MWWGLCYRDYAFVCADLLDGRRASTHWMAEQDFTRRFAQVQLDMTRYMSTTIA
ncbi:hypothetical protein [Comamonas endophytica]|uniref:hypothetical protein n=1 Tax=Comamonas endophytica TaxID=2949090 RepID=UPI001E5827EE|nr:MULTISPECIES: hypothetical protein [unclassified Acidovorax]MCD2514626.1 hypothetical protein [Acidovorax sp. D4N7]